MNNSFDFDTDEIVTSCEVFRNDPTVVLPKLLSNGEPMLQPIVARDQETKEQKLAFARFYANSVITLLQTPKHIRGF